MRILIINKSDRTGGAAMVSYRLLEAFRNEGIEARMLVTERLSDDPDVILAASPRRYRLPFLRERLKVAFLNGFDRRTLFKFDLGSDGIPLSSHPEVRKADAILINWVNQGMLSLKELERILELGKPVLWTLHDMWPFTAVCHHSGECERFRDECAGCPLLPAGKYSGKVLKRVMERKRCAYNHPNLGFVAVSSWLADRARKSSLLRDKPLFVIPNSFPIDRADSKRTEAFEKITEKPGTPDIRILFGAARLDDPIKNLPLLTAGLNSFIDSHPELKSRLRLVTYGGLKNPDAFAGLRVSHTNLGVIAPERIPELYSSSDIVISTSLYESLPGTLVEGQAYGAIPVATDRGGQRDIIEHRKTGYLVSFGNRGEHSSDTGQTVSKIKNPAQGPDEMTISNLKKGLEWALEVLSDPEKKSGVKTGMLKSVKERFDPPVIVRRYLEALRQLPSSR